MKEAWGQRAESGIERVHGLSYVKSKRPSQVPPQALQIREHGSLSDSVAKQYFTECENGPRRDYHPHQSILRESVAPVHFIHGLRPCSEHDECPLLRDYALAV